MGKFKGRSGNVREFRHLSSGGRGKNCSDICRRKGEASILGWKPEKSTFPTENQKDKYRLCSRDSKTDYGIAIYRFRNITSDSNVICESRDESSGSLSISGTGAKVTTALFSFIE